MANLIFRLSDGSEQRARLDGELSVGREEGNDVVLKDAGVSRRHCRLILDEDGQVWIEDLGSANGVLVGGERIEDQTALGEGEEALIGPVSLSVQPARRPAAPRPGRAPGARGPRPAGTPPRASPAARPAPEAGRAQRATRMMVAAELPPRRARPAMTERPGGAGGAGRPRLKGLSGRWAGQGYELDRPRLLVGRVAPADILVEDDSISRRHAEVYKVGSSLWLRDLGSANGTYLNGERVDEAQLSPGDVVRFGVVEMVYSGPGGAGGKVAAGPGRKRLLLIGAGGGGLLLLLIVGVMAGGSRTPPPPSGGLEVRERPPAQEDPIRLLGRCKAFSDCDNEQVDWEKAVETCARVIELDPALTEARTLERLARKELGFQEKLKEAKLKVATSQDDAAIKLLTEIESSSCFFSRARSEFKDAVDRIAKRAKTECRTEFKAGYYQAAYVACRRFKEVTCNTSEVDREIERLLKLVESKTGGSTPFACPPEYRQFQGGALAAMVTYSANAEEAIRKMYPDSAISSVMIRYLNTGRPKQLSDELKRLRGKMARKYGDSLDSLIARLDLIDGRYSRGQEGLLRNNPDETEGYWKTALEADGSLMPEGVRSYMAKDMGAQLAAAFYKVGMDALRKEKLSEGFKSFFRGWQYDKANNDILIQLAGMERAASQALRESGCDNVAFALEITIPDGDVNKKAKEMKAELNCP